MATWAERFDQARLINQQRQRENAFNDLVASAYTPDQTVTTQVPTYGPMPDGSVPPVVAQSQTTPGGMDWKTLIGRLAQGGFGQQAIALQNQMEGQDRDVRKVMLEYQLRDAMQNRQFDRAEQLARALQGSGAGYGISTQVGPSGPTVTIDPSKGASTMMEIAKLRDQGINFGGPQPSGASVPQSAGVAPVDQRKIAAKRAESQPGAQAALGNLMANFDQLYNSAIGLTQHPGLNTGTGATYLSGYIPGTEAKGFTTDLDTLKNQIALGTMQSLKAASSTGSTGFGSLSNQEGELLKNNIANLDRARKTGDVVNSLNSVADYALNAKKRAIESYANEYGATPEIIQALNDVNGAIARQRQARKSPSTPQGQTSAGQIRNLNGQTYVNVNGQWFQQ